MPVDFIANVSTMTSGNGTTSVHRGMREDNVTEDDATWILTSAFIIFTMQSGFGLLESGSVSVKNELNIMVKNAVDVVFGGLTYWSFGYGLSFGDHEYSNPFVGWGNFFVNADEDNLGVVYSKFFFQASFATTATTIVSGAMAERTKLTSYMVFSMFNTILFSVPAHWVWSSKGWLYRLGVVDIAGAGPVHIVGGVTGLVATLMLKPRHGRFAGTAGRIPQMSSPTNAVLGMFMLWWGWLGFNCGSTFGISGLKWKLAARSAASTLCSSVAGGVAGFLLSYLVKNRTFDVTYIINGLLGSLVSITAVCAIVQPWEGLIIGFFGSIISNGGVALLDKLRIDDPVGCVGTHALSGSWGLLMAGLFIRKDRLLDALYLHGATAGLFYGGGFRQLGIQVLALVAIIVWTVIMSYAVLKVIDVTMGIRVSLEEEIIGADIVEHGIGDLVYNRRTKTVSYPPHIPDIDLEIEQNGTVMTRVTNETDPNHLFGHTHLLGHCGRRKTMHEINTELSRGLARQRTNSDWGSPTARSNDGNTNAVSGTIPNTTCMPGSPEVLTRTVNTTELAVSRLSLLQQLRNSVFSNKMKAGHLDLNENSHIMKRTKAKKDSVKLHNGVLNTDQTAGCMNEQTHKYSNISFISESNSSLNCNGRRRFSDHPSTDTVTIELSDRTENLVEIPDNTPSVINERTHF